MKMYCKNCKFNRNHIWVEFITCIPIASAKMIKREYYSPDYERKENPYIYSMAILNKNNDCRYYKRKW